MLPWLPKLPMSKIQDILNSFLYSKIEFQGQFSLFLTSETNKLKWANWLEFQLLSLELAIFSNRKVGLESRVFRNSDENVPNLIGTPGKIVATELILKCLIGTLGKY